MSDLTDFLLARFDEDEHWARLADGVTDKVENDWQDVTQPITHAMTQDRPQEQWVKKYGHAYEHIARHDPARVLADVEAKRRVLDEYEASDFCEKVAPGEVVMILALPYADHPDYREEWKP